MIFQYFSCAQYNVKEVFFNEITDNVVSEKLMYNASGGIAIGVQLPTTHSEKLSNFLEIFWKINFVNEII